jgi:hypothetical protein
VGGGDGKEERGGSGEERVERGGSRGEGRGREGTTLLSDLEEIVAEALEALCLVHMGPRLPLLLFNLLPLLCKPIPESVNSTSSRQLDRRGKKHPLMLGTHHLCVSSCSCLSFSSKSSRILSRSLCTNLSHWL